MVSFMQNLGYFYMNVMIQDYKWKLQVNFLENAIYAFWNTSFLYR